MRYAISLIIFTINCVLAAPSSAQVIYGNDNRMDMYQVLDPKIRELGKSVATRLHASQIDLKDETFSLSFAPLLSDEYGGQVCLDEKFADQPLAGDCSAFLVADDILATAGHCVLDSFGSIKNATNESCKNHKWLFDYAADKNGVKVKDLDVANLYSCEKIIYAEYDENDFALIKLDRKVEGRPVLELNPKKTKNTAQLFVIGYPSGLPLKYAGDAGIFQNKNKTFFSTNLDTFGGNSGSPVFNAQTNVVEGILVRGREDYVDSSEKNGGYCRRVNHCSQKRGDCLFDDKSIDGEHVNRLSKLLRFLPKVSKN